jgi:hypothetical protein
MSIFNFWNKKKENSSAMITTLPVMNPSMSAAEEVETNQDAPGATTEKKTLTVSYATGWPIDVVYGYLHKNNEEKGFNDAMVKSDLTFRDMNMSIIRNKILMVFREINLNYDVMKRDLEIRMDTCSAAGLLSTVSELEKSMSTIKAHKAELQKLEEDFRNNEKEASIPLQSYECGFLRGIATIALGNAGRTMTNPEIEIPEGISMTATA